MEISLWNKNQYFYSLKIKYPLYLSDVSELLYSLYSLSVNFTKSARKWNGQ